MKRSSCASGSSKVPDCSTGFCVAMTRNGVGRRMVWPPRVTLRSCMASSIAPCTFGAARLISSARRRFVKTGPRWMRKSPDFWSTTSEPTMSDGSISTVNWMRRKSKAMAFATVFTRSVFARPGIPCRSRWPPVRSAIMTRSTTMSWPTTTLPTRVRTSATNWWAAWTAAGLGWLLIF